MERKRVEWEEQLAKREKELEEKEAEFERKKSAMVTNVQQEEQDMKKVGVPSFLKKKSFW